MSTIKQYPWPIGLVIGIAIAVVAVAMALTALVAIPPEALAIDVVQKLKSPSLAHPLGTDHFGRDTLALVMRGAVASLTVATGAVVVGAGVGVPLGLIASTGETFGHHAIMRANEFIFAFPALVIAILLHATFGPGMANAIVAIGIFNIPIFARTTYASALPIWRRDFIRAAKLAGKGNGRIAFEHVAPLIAGLVIVQATLQFGLGLLAEAGLSYVGLGVMPPTPSWGRMLAEAQTLIVLAPRLAIVPGLAIAVTVLGFTLLGDALADLADPRRRRT